MPANLTEMLAKLLSFIAEVFTALGMEDIAAAITNAPIPMPIEE